MLDIFLRLKTLIKVSHIHIDSSVFRLHWCISSVILLTFSVIVTTRQYVGNPIDCIHTQVNPGWQTFIIIPNLSQLHLLFQKGIRQTVHQVLSFVNTLCTNTDEFGLFLNPSKYVHDRFFNRIGPSCVQQILKCFYTPYSTSNNHVLLIECW